MFGSGNFTTLKRERGGGVGALKKLHKLIHAVSVLTKDKKRKCLKNKNHFESISPVLISLPHWTTPRKSF